MPYTDRLRDMIYTSPSGREFTLLYDQVSQNAGKKAPVNEFPLQNQGAVQDLGQTTKSYPVTCYITGPDYDIDADAFAAALDETGPGTLEHPRYGTITVLPRSVQRQESFVDGAGRAVFTIDFVQADEVQFEYPRARTSVDDLIAVDIATAEAAAIAALETKTISAVRELAAVKDEVETTVEDLRVTFAETLANSTEAAEEFGAKTTTLLRDLDDIASDPAELFERIMEIVQIPIDVTDDVLRKAKAIRQSVDRIATRIGTLGQQYGDILALFSAATLQGFLAWIGGLTVNALFTTRSVSGKAIDEMQAARNAIKNALELAETSQPADYETQQAAEAAYNTALANLIDRQLSLPTERVITLDREVPATVLAWELYGDLDSLDEFIDYNAFDGDDLLMIPRGTEVRYYV